MSIPLDRLYHYIENIAKEIRGDDIIIYRFYPHGSKKIEDLSLIRTYPNWKLWQITPQIYCNDQEPLYFELYQNINQSKTLLSTVPSFKEFPLDLPDFNLTMSPFTVYDKSIILHSEQRSKNIELYANSCFVPVYYWSHSLIAMDWFRYAQHLSFKKTAETKKFLIYNRAWSNTREYRLKFLDLLVEHQLNDQCQTSVCVMEPELNIHYTQHNFKNSNWQPTRCLENYFPKNIVNSNYSADFDYNDYNTTDVEVVLETLFDDDRIHLTEKSLRPIACNQPFILMATHGSLEYLRKYGFKTFDGIIDESYDSIEDPQQRMLAVISAMKKIVSWSESERYSNMQKIQEITNYNQQRFFGQDFHNQVISELKCNLAQGLDTIERTNTGSRFLNLRKILYQFESARSMLLDGNFQRSREDIANVVKIAKQYQLKNL
jgi:hypothetical protein